MTHVFETLVLHHDPRLVLLAALVCAFGATSTMSVSGRAADHQGGNLWLGLTSVCAGATVWATHFIAMLAYRQGVAMTYDLGLTALSFASGVVVMGLGFALAIHGARAGVRWAHQLGGVVLGMGVVTLHYVGMAALRMPGELTYGPLMVAASVALSLGFGVPALTVAFGQQRPHSRPLAALLMVLMIVSLHFTAMGALHVELGVSGQAVAGGMSRTVLASAVAIASFSVLLIGLAGALLDQKLARRLAAEADRFRTLAEGAFEGLVVHRAGAIIDSNSTARRMLGLADGDRTSSIANYFGSGLDSAPEATSEPFEIELHRTDGTRFPAEIGRRRILLADGGEGELLAIRDLTSRKESEARIAHLALHDPLTELPNRRFFMELANKTISQAQRSGARFALLALDLDDFKVVNDEHGHAGGDELIRIVAQRIGSTLRDSDVAARFGGDEFAALQIGAYQPKQAVALAERLLEALREPVRLAYGEVRVTASIGIAIYPDDGASAEELLRSADTAMYRAKADGKAMSCFFEPHMDAAIVARRKIEHGLRRAIAEDGLTVAYQPIVESRTRRPIGFEALVRWHDPERGTVSPAEFIPVAEETGLIVPIGEIVLRRACRDATSWPDHLRVAVNLSAVQFRRKGLVDTVRSALEESGLPGERLDLEVTETLLVDNRQDVLRVLEELKGLGVRISMDDFGTGYSALSYLQSFPFDKIKIDRVFVADLGTNPQNESIVRAVAAMGRSLQMRVVAEGVETDHEADILNDIECDEMQGYLIAKPMPADDVDDFLRRHIELDAEEEVKGLRVVR